MKAYSMTTVLRHPEAITELYLSQGSWKEIPSQIFELPNLRVLEISHHGLVDLPASIEKLQQLERLILTGNRLTDLPPALALLPRLRILDLGANALQHFPEPASRLPALEVLSLAGNALQQFPAAITRIRGLRELDLSHCGLRRLPPTLTQLRGIQRLRLAGNALRQLPPPLFELSELTALDLSGNRLESFPALPAGSWPVLGQLLLAANRLPAVPDGIESCRLLQRLDLSGNRLTSCPASVASLPWLTALDLRNNRLPELPAALASCARLEQLDLGQNPLLALPGLPPTLRRLSLRQCSLTELPAAVTNATSLRSLDLSYNKISDLPSSFQQLRQLRHLDLRANNFQAFPAVMLTLDSLRELRGHPGGRARPLLSFLRACRQDATPGALRHPLFWALSGETTMLSKLPTALLLRALQFPVRRAALAAQAILTSGRGRSPDEYPLQPGARVAILGKTTFKKVELEQRLPAAGLHYSPAIDATTTHLLIGLKPAEVPPGIEDQCVFLAESTLSQYLDRTEERYLVNAAADSFDHLQQLLLSGQPANLRLALQLLRGGGVPPALHTDLLIAWKTTRDQRLRRDLRTLLERHIPETDKRVLSLPVALNDKLPAAQLRQNIEKLTNGTAFDATRIWQVLEERKNKKS